MQPLVYNSCVIIRRPVPSSSATAGGELGYGYLQVVIVMDGMRT